jgi:hypothetical protein
MAIGALATAKSSRRERFMMFLKNGDIRASLPKTSEPEFAGAD